MLDLEELKQLIAFADMGTLSKVAEEFNISTPSITRSMKNIEECMGVSLFNRSKNRIELNDTGKLAVEYARKLISEVEQMVEHIRIYDEKKKTIVVKSCAPAPLWRLLKKLQSRCAGKTIASEICRNEDVMQYLAQNECDIAILPYNINAVTSDEQQKQDGQGEAAGQEKHNKNLKEANLTLSGWKVAEFMVEHLYVCVPKTHKLAEYKSVKFAELNGFNFLLKSELGFWDTLCHKMMPSSKFLVQTDEAVFDEIVNASSLPCFTTDYFADYESIYKERVNIPITDEEANVTFYVIYREH